MTYWYPKDAEFCNDDVAHVFSVFRKYAINDEQFSNMSLESYDAALFGYLKETLGSDLWAASELKALPDFVRGYIVDDLNNALSRVAVPHQWLTTLNALLGKPSHD